MEVRAIAVTKAAMSAPAAATRSVVTLERSSSANVFRG